MKKPRRLCKKNLFQKRKYAFKFIGKLAGERAERKAKLMKSLGYTKFGIESDKEISDNRAIAKLCFGLAEVCKELIEYEENKRN